MSLSVPLIDAALALADTARNAATVQDDRMKALAGMNAALQATQMAKEAQALDSGSVGFKVTVSLSDSSSRDSSSEVASTAVGSQVQAGGNLRIKATGDGSNSTLNITGSDITPAMATEVTNGMATIPQAPCSRGVCGTAALAPMSQLID